MLPVDGVERFFGLKSRPIVHGLSKQGNDYALYSLLFTTCYAHLTSCSVAIVLRVAGLVLCWIEGSVGAGPDWCQMVSARDKETLFEYEE